MSSEPTFELRAVGYDHPDAVALTVQVQAFYVEVYGGRDTTPWAYADFAPPRGGFVVGYLHRAPVAMGGWRFRAPLEIATRPAELKRMYVVPAVRRAGLARRLLARLESDAAAAGADGVVLETGTPQVAAVAFYAAAGYAPVDGFGHYPGSVTLGKRLGA